MSEKPKSRVQKRKAEQKNKKQKNSKKVIAKRIFLTLLVVGFITLIGGIVTFAVMASGAPDLDPQKLKDPVPSKIYDMDKNLITELGAEKRDLVEFDEIPELVKNAILATEDVRFFNHHGIDPIRLGGAVLSNITDGFGSQGASTITQQVVKLSYLSHEKTIKRKAQEAWLAVKLEMNYTKEDIFEMYVNKIHMGGNVYGVKMAAKTYFDKELDELTLPEAAMIAGIPQRPNGQNPFVNPEAADKRKNTVLHLMHQHGFISKEDMEEAQNIHISTLAADPKDTVDDTPFDSFIDQIIDEVEKLGYNPYTDGLEIYTTMDPKAQKRVHDILNTKEYVKFPNEKIQAGVVLLDTQTGEIRAIGGGRHQKVRRGLNYAIDIKRQPGSTAKPVLAYGPAIENLKWSTYHLLDDSEHKYSDGTPLRNWNKKYTGVQTMRYHLAQSRNIPAVKAIQEVGTERAQEFAEGLGLPFEKNETVSEAYAIGGFDKGLAPVHLAGAYAAFGNGGIYNEPHAIRKIVLGDGITEIEMKPQSRVAMSDYTAFMITDMLKSAVRNGTGTRAAVSGVPIAGKTGTTNYTENELKKYKLSGGSPDAWFAGYSTNYTAAIWVGYENKNSPVDDTRLPQYIFKNLMTFVHQGVNTPDFKQPNSVVRLPIEKGSNPAKLASPFTPEDQIVYEYFVKGNEPTETSEKYQDVPAVTNLKIEYNENSQKGKLTWDYEKVKDITFEVYVSLDGSTEELVKETDKNGLNIEQIVPGHQYTFTVYAVYDGQKSEPVSVNLDLSAVVEEPEEPDEPDDGTGSNPPGNPPGQPGNNGNTKPPGNGNNGNNNGNGDDQQNDDDNPGGEEDNQ